MQRQRIRSIFLLLLLSGVLYNLYMVKTHRRTLTSIQVNENPKRNQGNMATHFLMPSLYKGKKLPFHHVYEPRAVGFPENFNVSTFCNKTKVILIWTSWNSVRRTINYYFLQPGNRTFAKYKCPNPNCFVTFRRKNLSKADAVLFHLLDTKTDDLPAIRYPHQIWILYNMEPPWQVRKHAKSQLQALNYLFNWTMSYRINSDVVARYGFTGIPTNPQNRSFSGIVERKSGNVVWFVSDCSTDSKREDYVNEMKKYIDVDVYGKCGNSKCYPSQSSTCYKDVLRDYKFYLSFENALCKDYVTEKFFNVFNYDIIPVVMGSADYASLAPKDSFIDAARYPLPKTLAEALLKIASNETVYVGFLERKARLQAYLDPWMCRLCDKLHSRTRTTVLEDVGKWFFGDAECRKWNSSLHTYVHTQLLKAS